MTLHFFCCHYVLLLNIIFLFLFDLEIVESADTGTSDALGVDKIQPNSAARAVNTLTGI